MSAPMGVPTQRITSKASSKGRPTLNAITKPFNSTKVKSPHPLTSPTSHSERGTVKSPMKLENNQSVSSEQRKLENAVPGAESPSKSKRKIATNSRIKGLQTKGDQTKRDLYLAFINNALKAKSEVSFGFDETASNSNLHRK